jgi:hypothetical protein
MCLLNSKAIGERRILNDIEFYFPQWAQLIIQLHGPSANNACELGAEAIEKFVVTVCQLSVDLATQLYFALIAAVDDSRPELPNGMNNPDVSIPRFIHCCRLINIVFRAVVYGSPALSSIEEANISQHYSLFELGELYNKERGQRVEEIVEYSLLLSNSNRDKNDKIAPSASRSQQNSSFESFRAGNGNVSKTSDPLNVAGSVSGLEANSALVDYVSNCAKCGVLLFKRNIRKSALAPKPWKPRFFVVKDRILYCFHDELGQKYRGPMRAVHLSMCIVEELPNAKHPFTISVRSPMTDTVFLLRASDADVFNGWINFLVW